MHSTSLYVGYPRSPFKFPAFINALLFLCHTSGLKLFPGGSVLLHPSSNAGLHSRYLLQPSTNAGLYPSSNAGLYPRCHRSPWLKKFEGGYPSLTLKSSLRNEPFESGLYAGLLPSSNNGQRPRCRKLPRSFKRLNEFSRA